MNSILFNSSKNKVERIATIPIKGKENKIVKELFQTNFREIFPDPHLILLTKDKVYEIQHGNEKGRKLDDLAFHETQKTFFIFEYKSEVNRGVIEQALTYRNALLEDANRYHLRDILNEYLKKKGKKEWKLENFEWEDMRIVCISPFFTDYQKGAQDKKISLVKITIYKNETFLLESKNTELFKGDGKVRIKSTEKPNDIEKVLDNLNASDWVREKVLSINELMTNLFGEQLKWNVAWKKFIYYQRKKEYLLGILIRQKFIWLSCQANQLTENWSKNEAWPKQLNREIKLDNEENFQKVINAYLKLLKIK